MIAAGLLVLIVGLAFWLARAEKKHDRSTLGNIEWARLYCLRPMDFGFLVGMARPQVLKCQDRGGVFRLCSIGFLLSFVVMAVSWSKFNGVA